MNTQLTPGFGTGVVEDTRLDERTRTTDDGDHERLSHYVPKDKLMDAMVNGTPVVALCGKVWVPSRDPEKYPVCPECKEIWESLRSGEGA
ncbi:MAG TPA: DUF3039 domain-containing protein [Marmoricola sp.]|nr:DUF3039 domain-containing protein [Marmoricola sp.]